MVPPSIRWVVALMWSGVPLAAAFCCAFADPVARSAASASTLACVRLKFDIWLSPRPLGDGRHHREQGLCEQEASIGALTERVPRRVNGNVLTGRVGYTTPEVHAQAAHLLDVGRRCFWPALTRGTDGGRCYAGAHAALQCR